tara:strand:+ start:401 stop:622 length:222 start_codon:yes stop_codon:yes gene_type:complete
MLSLNVIGSSPLETDEYSLLALTDANTRAIVEDGVVSALKLFGNLCLRNQLCAVLEPLKRAVRAVDWMWVEGL